jgi:putative pyruvate formate lyase activating enzyme
MPSYLALHASGELRRRADEAVRALARCEVCPDCVFCNFNEMHRQVGPLAIGEDGLARRGVLVRHLVMPGLVQESRAIFEWLARDLSPDTYVNVMGQYRPEYKASAYPEIARTPTRAEMDEARLAAREAGLTRFD